MSALPTRPMPPDDHSEPAAPTEMPEWLMALKPSAEDVISTTGPVEAVAGGDPAVLSARPATAAPGQAAEQAMVPLTGSIAEHLATMETTPAATLPTNTGRAAADAAAVSSPSGPAATLPDRRTGWAISEPSAAGGAAGGVGLLGEDDLPAWLKALGTATPAPAKLGPPRPLPAEGGQQSIPAWAQSATPPLAVGRVGEAGPAEEQPSVWGQRVSRPAPEMTTGAGVFATLAEVVVTGAPVEEPTPAPAPAKRLQLSWPVIVAAAIVLLLLLVVAALLVLR